MSQERFEKGMKELKNKYKEEASTTSTKEIFQSIQLEKNKRGQRQPFQYGAVIAATIAIFLIGCVLIGSLLAGNDTANDVTESPPVLDGVASSDDNKKEDSEKEETSVITEVNRSETLTKTAAPEGMEEEIEYELYVSEHLGYSTYLHPDMETAEISSDGEFREIHSIFLGDIQVSRTDDETGLIKNISFAEEGYEEVSLEHSLFDNVVHYSVWSHLTDPLLMYYVVVEGLNGSFYELKINLTIEMEDGYFPWVVETFIEEMEFHE
ncbi:hypothetical protein J2S74_005487 [Evansella vedderi]|uniref:Uncharacterized protein n=1 Tax=Evansella vedderi TaxID=38282 RepID=A0ABU0A4J4_9BACI|nr:hypothetical protein [Evansella vedderi]MDQ0258024.1 hypothetical protein [Evansella vedderi]